MTRSLVNKARNKPKTGSLQTRILKGMQKKSAKIQGLKQRLAQYKNVGYNTILEKDLKVRERLNENSKINGDGS